MAPLVELQFCQKYSWRLSTTVADEAQVFVLNEVNYQNITLLTVIE